MSVQTNELINRRNQAQLSLSRAQSTKTLIQTKIERLERAKFEISSLMFELSTVNQRMKSYSIQGQLWRGLRKDEFDTSSRMKMNSALSRYNEHVSDLGNQIENEICTWRVDSVI